MPGYFNGVFEVAYQTSYELDNSASGEDLSQWRRKPPISLIIIVFMSLICIKFANNYFYPVYSVKFDQVFFGNLISGIMIVKFEIGNFRSILETVEINMVKTSLKGLSQNYFRAPKNYSLLKSAILYGHNASGKSTVLRAFKALEFLVQMSSGFKPDQPIGPYEPHKLDKKASQAPVSFRLEFIAQNNIPYEYRIAFSAQAIEQEELWYYPNAVKTLLYAREKGKEIKFGDSYKGARKAVEKLLLPNQLFLSKAAENNVESLLDPYLFFRKGIMVFPFLEEESESDLSQLYAWRLAEDKNSKFAKRFNHLICALDTGITSVSVKETDWNSFQFPTHVPEDLKNRFQNEYRFDIKTQHAVFQDRVEIGFESFDIDEESKGTRSLFVMAGIILDALETGRVLIVDEFEKNLHPGITQFLIKLFHSPLTNPKNAQLIFATHDITQLSHDNFRRDQVWFTEKDEFGVTALHRCSDIKGVRLGTPLDKWYQSGRFGGTPIINDVDFLIAMQDHDED